MTKRRNPDKIRVGDVLLQKGLINQTQLKQALATQKSSSNKLGEILVQQGVVTPKQVRQALNEQAWRNVVATFVLSASTLLPSLPKAIAQIPDVPHHRERHDQPLTTHEDVASGEFDGTPAAQEIIPQVPSFSHQHNHPLPLHEDIGGSESNGTPAAQSASIRYPDSVQSPLANQASVASPLRGFCHPLNGQGWLSQGIRGTTHQGRMEFAYDLATSIGTPVYSMRSGRVIAVQDKYPDMGGGKENASRFNYVWVEHDEGYRSIYVHLQQGFRSKVSIKAGDQVEAGQLIGYSGNSGWSTGPHLHVEVQKPSKRRTFTKTVPFAIAGACQDEKIAQNPR